MTILEQFFAGVLTQLQSEVDLINALVPHNATKGTLNEESLRRLFQSFLPTRYGIGTGLVLDSFGKRSRQVDLLIYDDFHAPTLFRTFSQVLYPVETVFACVEVKTRLKKKELSEIADANRDIAALRHSIPVVRKIEASQKLANSIELSELNTIPPMTYLVAYHTETDNPSTIRDWYEDHAAKEDLPDMALFLDLCMIAYRPKPMLKTEFDFLLITGRNTDIGDPEPSILYLKEPAATISLNGRTYQSSRWQGKSGYPLLMPEKALLQFLIQMSRAVNAFPKHDFFDPTPYLAIGSDQGVEVL